MNLTGSSRVYRVRLLVTLVLVTVIFTSVFYVLTRKWGQGEVLTLDREEYQIDNRAVLTVRNIWKSSILVGVGYSLSRKVDGSWVWVPVQGSGEAWDAALRVLSPGESYRQVIDLEGFQTGEYRLRKEIVHKDEETRAYYIGFRITG
jgi:hypothetical protein